MEKTDPIILDLSDPHTLLYNVGLLEDQMRKEVRQTKNGLVDLGKVVSEAKQHFKPSER